MAIPTGDQGGIFASINITPLTDIFLVLLIIFMVATAVTIESAAHVDLPQLQAANQTQQPRGVTVTYTADHQIFVNQQSVKETELGAAVSAALAKTPEKTVVFNGDPSVILGDAVRIVDIAKTAGADSIALAVSAASGPPPVGDTVPAEGAPGPEGVTPGPAPEPVAPGGP
ncbi:MAG: ExbD/TolR family protein [Candidatus Binataceae bacterium]